MRNVFNAKHNSHVNPLFLKLKLLNVADTFNYNLGIFMYKYTYSMVPKSFTNFFKKLQMHDRSLNYVTKRVYSEGLRTIPSNTLPKFWNSLKLELKRSSSLNLFKKELKKHFHFMYPTTCTKVNCYSCN